MRKVLMTLLCIAAITACGPKGGKKAAAGNEGEGEGNLEKVAENIAKDTFNGEKNTAEAASFWFKKRFNIPIADVTPDFEYGKETGKYDFLGEEMSASYVTFVAKDSTLHRDDLIAYVKKVYAATAKAADGGNIYGFHMDGTRGIELYTGSYSWNVIKDGTYYMVDVKQLEKRKNGEDKPFAARTIIGQGLQKSMQETMDEAEKALSDPEVQKQIEKALKDKSK